MKSGFSLLKTKSKEIACLLRLFGFECMSADKIFNYDTKKTSLNFLFLDKSELNEDIDGHAVLLYAESIIDKRKNFDYSKAEDKLDTETKVQIDTCVNFLKIYNTLVERLTKSTYLTVEIKRNGKTWKIPNMGDDWEKFKKKFNIKGVKTHKDHE